VGSDGVASSEARDINGIGEIVGFAQKYAAGLAKGNRALRWAPGSTIPTELGTLGVRYDGYAYAIATENNSSGTTIGSSDLYVNGSTGGFRAVRWDAGSTDAIELGNIGTAADGTTTSAATDINDAGRIVGFARVPTTSGLLWEALLWEPGSTNPVDLNSFLDPNSGWYLEKAFGISNTNWVTGIGQYQGYDRQFLIQIPDPASFALLTLAVTLHLSGGRVRRARA
jgi:uncharacterized membrane protein